MKIIKKQVLEKVTINGTEYPSKWEYIFEDGKKLIYDYSDKSYVELVCKLYDIQKPISKMKFQNRIKKENSDLNLEFFLHQKKDPLAVKGFSYICGHIKDRNRGKCVYVDSDFFNTKGLPEYKFLIRFANNEKDYGSLGYQNRFTTEKEVFKNIYDMFHSDREWNRKSIFIKKGE